MICYLVLALILVGNPELPHFKIPPAKVADPSFTGQYQCNVTDAGDWIMKKIQVNSKKYGVHYALVDDEDYELVKKYSWYASPAYSKNNFYAKSRTRDNKWIFMHRLIMDFPKCVIDHRNGLGLDNRKINLRKANDSQNGMNRMRLNANNTSGFKGVYWSSGKWRATIMVNRKHIRGGRFLDKVEAAKKYNEMAVKYHGKFATLNKIPS